MRKEPYAVGSYVHVLKRGAKKTPIVRDDNDRWRFLKLLRYLNDENVPRNWERDISSDHIANNFERPSHWPAQKPYVSILAYCLMDNHFHLLVQERVDDGISKFMQRLCTSMTANFNAKYQENGTLFQGAYKARTVDSDEYLQRLAIYIQVKNTFDLDSRGLLASIRQFDAAFRAAEAYAFSSLPAYTHRSNSALLDMDSITELFDTGDAFVHAAREVMRERLDDQILRKLAMGI